VRWDALFADLESQFAAMHDSDMYGEVADRIRAEMGRITVLDRLRGALGTVVRLDLLGSRTVAGELVRVGKDCLLVASGRTEEWLVSVAAVTAVHGLGPWADQAESTVSGRLGLTHLLRGIARDRSPVTVFCAGAEQAVSGTIDRVGADFLELAEHPLDTPRRRAEVSNVRLVPLAALVAVRRR
jgi:hypothetical protein